MFSPARAREYTHTQTGAHPKQKKGSFARAHEDTHVHTCADLYVCLSLFLYIYACVAVCLHFCMSLFSVCCYISICASLFPCLHVCLYISASVYLRPPILLKVCCRIDLSLLTHLQQIFSNGQRWEPILFDLSPLYGACHDTASG